MQQYQLTFLDLALKRAALRFGRFTLKSGRESPYFFNAGLFSDGESLLVLGRCYAAATGRIMIQLGGHRGVYTSAWVGALVALGGVGAAVVDHRRDVPVQRADGGDVLRLLAPREQHRPAAARRRSAR